MYIANYHTAILPESTEIYLLRFDRGIRKKYP